MSRQRFTMLFLALLGLLAGAAFWGLLHSEAFWSWSGHRLLALVQERLPGTLTVGGISGTPFTGLTVTEIAYTAPRLAVVKAPRLTVRFSLWSLVKRQPVIAEVVLAQPRIVLELKPPPLSPAAAPPSPAPEPASGPAPAPVAAPPPEPTPAASEVLRALTFHLIHVQDGDLTLSLPQGEVHWDHLDLEMALSILHPGTPEQTWLLRRASLGVTAPQGRFHLAARGSYSHQLFRLLALNLELQGDRLLGISGEARLGEHTPWLRLHGEVGPLTGRQVQLFLARWPEAWGLDAALNLEGDLQNLRFTGKGTLAGARFTCQGVTAPQAEAWSHLDLKLENLKPETLAALQPSWQTHLKNLSPLNLAVRGQTRDLRQPLHRFTAEVDCQPFSFGARKISQAKVVLAGAGGQETLHGWLHGNFGRLTLEAAGPLLATKRGGVKVQAENLQPALLGLAAPHDSLITGRFTGSFRVPEPLAWERVWISGDLLAQGQWGRVPLQDLRSRLTWEKPRLHLSQLSVRLGGLSAEAQGLIAAGELNLRFAARLSPEGGWPLPTAWRGRVHGEGTLTGTLDRPRLTWQAKGQDVSLSPELSCRHLALQANLSGWLPSDGSLNIQFQGLKTPLVSFSQAGFTCHGDAGLWRFHGSTRSSQGSSLTLNGRADLSRRPFALTLATFRLQTPRFTAATTAPVQMSFAPGLTVAPFHVNLAGGHLTGKADIQGRELFAALNWEKLPASLLGLNGLDEAGNLRGRILVQGETRQPVLEGQLALGPGRYGAFEFSSLHTEFRYRQDRLTVSGGLAEKAAPGPRLSWEGRLPVRFSLSPWHWSWGTEDMRLQLTGERANLALLSAFTREVTSANGSLTIQALWQGKMPHPRVSGQVRWEPGEITFRQGGAAYRLQAGEIRLQGNTLTLAPLFLESGGGTATLSGTAALDGFLPRQVQLKAQLENFRALARRGSEAWGSGTLSLTGPWSAMVLKGHLQVSQATFHTAFFQTGTHDDINLNCNGKKTPPPEPGGPPPPAPEGAPQAAFIKNLNLEIVLETPGKVWVKNNRLKAEVAGRLVARKPPGEPIVVGGDLRALQGTFEIQDHPFKIVRAVLHLPGKFREDAILEAQVSYDQDDVTLLVDATGPVKKPQVRMSSIPPLPPADVLSYLVFGRPARTLTRDQFLTVGQQAAGLIGGMTAKKIQEFLGKDFPLVGDITVQSREEAIGVAKPLTKDLTISLERKTTPVYKDDPNQIRLEYRLQKYLSVESQLGRRNSGADALLNLDF